MVRKPSCVDHDSTVPPRNEPTMKRNASTPSLTALVTTHNEAGNIAACIESLLWCDEILLVDSFSTDRTVEIARRYEKITVLERTYYGGASQKNWAIDRIRSDWILILDADERVTPELRTEIEKLLQSGPGADAFTIKRTTLFQGRKIRFSGWQHDRVVRLFRPGAARYPNRRVHADMLTRGPAPVLRHPIMHHMIDDVPEYLRRVNRYAYWGAAQLWREGRSSGPPKVASRSLWRLLRTYFLQLGILDGMPGLILCLLQGYGTFLKWAILWSWHAGRARGRAPDLPAFDEDEKTWAWPEQIASSQRAGDLSWAPQLGPAAAETTQPARFGVAPPRDTDGEVVRVANDDHIAPGALARSG